MDAEKRDVTALTLNELLSVLRKAERGLLVALGWMPYMSDVPEEQKTTLSIDLNTHSESLGSVREALVKVQKAIIDREASNV